MDTSRAGCYVSSTRNHPGRVSLGFSSLFSATFLIKRAAQNAASPMPEQTPTIPCDVTVIGGGLAGKAASLHLARAGLQVVCIEPSESGRQAVGESLDWSSPELLNALGFPMDELVRSQMATWKKHVILKMRDGAPENYVPLPWLGRA